VMTSPVKALHIETNQLEPYAMQRQVEAVYSSMAEVFPLDIKIQLVCDAWLLTNATVKAKALSLQAHQN